MKTLEFKNSLVYYDIENAYKNELIEFYYCNKHNKLFKIHNFIGVFLDLKSKYVLFTYKDDQRIVSKKIRITYHKRTTFYSDIKSFYKDYKNLESDNQALADKYLNSYNTKIKELQENKEYLANLEKEYAEYLI